MKAIKKLLFSFKYALSGLLFCFKTGRNFRIHIIAALFVLYFSRFYSFSSVEYSLLIFLVAFILAAECINTAIEQLCDAVTTEYSTHIKKAKDVAAGAVMCGAIASVVIAFILFFDRDVFKQIYVYYSSSIKLVFLFITIVLSIIIIFIEDIFKNAKQ